MVTMNWHVIWVSFSVHINYYLTWAAIPCDVVCILLWCVSLVTYTGVSLFTHLLWVCLTFCWVCFSKCFRISSTVSTALLHNWFWRYCSIVIVVAFMCLIFSGDNSTCLCDTYYVWSAVFGYDLLSLALCYRSLSTIIVLNCYSTP